MSIPNMLRALVDDKKIEDESAFKSVIAHKVGSALDLKRVQVANSLVTQHVPQEVDTEGEDV